MLNSTENIIIYYLCKLKSMFYTEITKEDSTNNSTNNSTNSPQQSIIPELFSVHHTISNERQSQLLIAQNNI